MKIKYEFATETVEIEVTEEWGDILVELNRQEYNNNHKETRRHTTLSNGFDDGEWLSIEDEDIARIFESETDEDRLHTALSKLKPEQQRLLLAVYFERMSMKEYAHREGVSPSAITQRMSVAIKNLKEIF